MSAEDRRPSCWVAAEARLKTALDLVPVMRSPIPPEYWQLLAEAQVLATLAAAPPDVIAPLMQHERRLQQSAHEAHERISDAIHLATTTEGN